MRRRARPDFAGLRARHPDLAGVLSQVEAALVLLTCTIEGGGIIYVRGNGGSAGRRGTHRG